MLLTLDGLASVVEILEDGSSAPRLYGPREVQDPPPTAPPCFLSAIGAKSTPASWRLTVS